MVSVLASPGIDTKYSAVVLHTLPTAVAAAALVAQQLAAVLASRPHIVMSDVRLAEVSRFAGGM